jgi:hypothetical protein
MVAAAAAAAAAAAKRKLRVKHRVHILLLFFERARYSRRV